jgi:integrase
MAKVQRGWLRKKKYAGGLTWLFCFQVTRASDGKRVENSKTVGLVADFPNEKAAWMEVGRLGLERYLDNPIGPVPTVREIAEHWRLHGLRRKDGIIGKKADETADRDEHNLDEYVLPRWGDSVAVTVKPTQLEAWFEVLASTPQVAKNKPLKWPTVDKINSVMSQVYAHAQRHGLIPAEMSCNPFRPPKLGGARCKSTSDYEAKVVNPEQMVAILAELDRPESELEWTLALVHAATALRPEECFALKWCDIEWTNNQILVRRAWSKGKETDGKTFGSMKPVAMHPALAEYLQQWQNATPYSKDSDWVFASFREKGRIPRAASSCGKQYLRPAAVTAGVIGEDDKSRFGWHNLRHSLATFFASNDVHPSVIQNMLRHAKQQTTARYIHRVNDEQIQAQGLFLDAIKVRRTSPRISRRNRTRVESRVGCHKGKSATL